MRAEGAPGRGGGADQEARRLTIAGTAAAATTEWTAIGLGGNLGGRAAIEARFTEAIAAIEAACGVPARRSPLVRSAAVGPVAAQPEFVNAVVALPWQPVAPRALLDLLLAIEARHGRVRAVAQGPRTLDLDLLLVGRRALAGPGLVVPHPRLHQRRFVLEPLRALVGPGFVLPDGRALDPLLASPAIAAQDVALC